MSGGGTFIVGSSSLAPPLNLLVRLDFTIFHKNHGFTMVIGVIILNECDLVIDPAQNRGVFGEGNSIVVKARLGDHELVAEVEGI